MSSLRLASVLLHSCSFICSLLCSELPSGVADVAGYLGSATGRNWSLQPQSPGGTETCYQPRVQKWISPQLSLERIVVPIYTLIAPLWYILSWRTSLEVLYYLHKENLKKNNINSFKGLSLGDNFQCMIQEEEFVVSRHTGQYHVCTCRGSWC